MVTLHAQRLKPKHSTKDQKDTSGDRGSKWYHNIPIPILFINLEEIKINE